MVAVLSRSGATISEVVRDDVRSYASADVQTDNVSSVVVSAADSGDAARVARLLSLSGVERPNIVFCDPGQLPRIQAYAVVVCHRHHHQAPISLPPAGTKVSRIMVLSDCAREETTVGFLRSGARHVFNLHDSDHVLQARLEAGLRQHRKISLRSFVEGDIHFDVQKRNVTRAGRPIELSPKEFEFARHVFSRLDKVVRNTELMTSVWSLPPHMDTRRIDTAACRVRKKLGLCRGGGWELKRIRRVGYRLSRVEPSLELVEQG